MTPAEYLEFERKSAFRHEYVDGEIFEMGGANKRHNRISTNIVRLLDNQMLERDCNVYGSDMRVRITSTVKADSGKFGWRKMKIRFLREGGFDVQNLVTIPHVKIIRKLGSLTDLQMTEVEKVLRFWLDL